MIILILLAPILLFLLFVLFCSLRDTIDEESIKLSQELEEKERLSREGLESIEINQGGIEDEQS